MLNAEKLQIETTIEKINKQILELDNNNEYNPVLRKFQTIYDVKKVEDKIELIKSATDKFSNDIKIITENKDTTAAQHKNKITTHLFKDFSSLKSNNSPMLF